MTSELHITKTRNNIFHSGYYDTPLSKKTNNLISTIARSRLPAPLNRTAVLSEIQIYQFLTEGTDTGRKCIDFRLERCIVK